jgi:glutathione S-transferase
MTMSITLYYAPHSSASPVGWALAELGLEHETVELDLKAGDQKKPGVMALNPMGQVPTLVVNGQAMFESSACTIFLGDTYGSEKGLWPAIGSPDHMIALTWIGWAAVTLNTTLRQILWNDPDTAPEGFANEAQQAAARQRLDELMEIFDGHLSDREYITGDTFSLADCYVGCVLAWGTKAVGFDQDNAPQIAAWLQRCMGREAAAVM